MAAWMLALAVRALWLSLVNAPSRMEFSDMGGYLQRSGEILARTRWDPYVFFQGAGYPLVLAGVRRAWGSDGDVGLVVAWIQIAASLAALAGTVHLARAVVGRRGAAVALVVGALHVPWIFFASVYMPEALYAAALAALGLVLLKLARAPDARWGWTLLLGLCGAAAAWQKSTHLLVGPIAAVVWLFPLRRGWRGSFRILAGWMAGLALAFWIPHGVLSERTTGRFMASPPAGGLNFVEGKCPWKENRDSAGYAYWSPLFFQRGLRNTRSWPRPFLDQGYFYREGLRCIAERPIVLLESLDGLRDLFLANELWPANEANRRASGLSAAWARVVEWPLVAGVLLAAALALARALRSQVATEEARVVWLALVAPVLSLAAVVVITKSELRFRVPFDVFFFPLAVWGWTEAARWCAARVRARWTAADAAAATPSRAP